MSDTTMRRIAKEDLRFRTYVIKVRQMLSEAAKTNRIPRCNLLLASKQSRFESNGLLCLELH